MSRQPKSTRIMTRVAINAIANNTAKRGNTMADDKTVKAATETVEQVNELLPLMTVTLDQINADPRFNVRKNYTEKMDGDRTLTEEESIARLADSIESDGQLSPLIVARNTKGGYDLVAGFRRFKALQLLSKRVRKDGAKTPVMARIQVKEFAKPVEAHYLNVTENLQRANLRPYEIGLKAKFLRDEHEEKGATIARVFGYEPKYVNNLMRCLDKLDPRIISAWAEDHPKATLANLLPLAGPDKSYDEQWERWQLILNPNAGDDEGDEAGGDGDDAGEGGEATPPTPKRPSMSTLESAIEAITKDKDADPEWRKGALAALKFATGKASKVGSYDPKKARAAAEKAKAEKAAAKSKDKDDARADA